MKKNTMTVVDYIILGAGPAGLQMAYFLSRAGRSYLVLEKASAPGAFFKRFPRHGKLISINKVYTGFDDPEKNLRWDWNSLLSDSTQLLFKKFNKSYFPPAHALVKYLARYQKELKLKTRFRVNVVSIRRKNDFVLTDSKGREYRCKRLIVATGLTQPYIPEIPGIHLVENYASFRNDPKIYRNKRVLILGKGNSAFETADALIETAAVIHLASPRPVSMAWKTHFVGHLRAVNNNILDTYQLKLQNAILDAEVKSITKKNGKYQVTFLYTHAHGETEVLEYDRIISCTGFKFDCSIYEKEIRPKMAINARFPKQTCEWQSENVPDLYFSGTLMQMRDYRSTSSGFIHGFRYNIRSLFHILEAKYSNSPWPRVTVKASPDELRRHILHRINRSSALWQQFGFLADIIVLRRNDRNAEYFEEMPVDYAATAPFKTDYYIAITLEYGKEGIHQDPFTIARIHRDDIKNSAQSTFLHPVIRLCSKEKVLSTHHIIEDLAAEWKEPVHTKPLLDYLSQTLKEIGAKKDCMPNGHQF